ncbi:hypothetical protein LIER_22221 [Lithospermum erythrorhizon]|uniref:Uncharacterized protein n=1 Tax=Lithospermum erythrorhizon TaxID=34254 RepID=A0AAV3QVD3_LITER
MPFTDKLDAMEVNPMRSEGEEDNSPGKQKEGGTA